MIIIFLFLVQCLIEMTITFDSLRVRVLQDIHEKLFLMSLLRSKSTIPLASGPLWAPGSLFLGNLGSFIFKSWLAIFLSSQKLSLDFLYEHVCWLFRAFLRYLMHQNWLKALVLFQFLLVLVPTYPSKPE